MRLHSVNAVTEMPTREILIQRAHALGPLLTRELPAADARRDISAEVLDRMDEAGLLRLLRPAAWGGLEVDLATYFDVQNVIAEYCLSTAWIFGVINAQSYWLARFAHQAQADVWDVPGRWLVCSAFKPGGTATRVPGGFRLEGQWAFSSGSSHCQWALIGALVPAEGGDGPPAMCLFLIPRADYEIVDTWNSFGLRATGSNDLKVAGAFVPDYRTWKPDPGLAMTDASPQSGPALYRLPWGYVFGGSVCNLAIGAGRAAIAKFRDHLRTKLNTPALTPLAQQQATLALARAQAEVEGADMMIKAHCTAFMQCADRGTAIAPETALLFRTQMSGILRSIAAQVDQLMLATGGRGIEAEGPLTRIWLDLSAARHHPVNNTDVTHALLGRAMLGG